MTKQYLITAGIMGATTVIMGAIGSHLLKGNISPENMNQFNTALMFQMFNTAVLLSVTFMNRYLKRAYLNTFFYLFVLGTILFCIPLYLTSLKELTGNIFGFMGKAAPFGALLMIAGWITIIINGITYHHRKRSSNG